MTRWSDDTVRNGAAPDCVIATEMIILQADTAKVPLRELVDVFAAILTVNVALPDPLAGVTEIHGENEVTIQSILHLTVTGIVDETAGEKIFTSDTVNPMPSWLTMIFTVMPPADTVTVPLREVFEGLSVTVTATVASPAPLAGETAIHSVSSLTFQG